ncbi:MAG: M48 family metallopeptidase [Firmicutes bacterium]|nr:M48 family metallopeptidase [Bacillota bacterium]
MRWVIIGLVIFVYVVETVVALLNQRHSLKPLPKYVQDVYDHSRYEKWLNYSLEGHRLDLVRKGFGLLLLLVLLWGPFASLGEWVALRTTHPIVESLLFLGVYQTLITLLLLPFGIYRTFFIEERHGFNRTGITTFARDQITSYLVTLVLGGLILGAIHALYLRFSENLWTFIFITWSVLSVIMLFAVAFFGKLLLRLFNKFTPLPEGQLRSRIGQLASAVGFNLKAILVMDASKRSSKSNAAFTGIGKTREVILYDTLLENMSEDEILAVLAHELGHAVHKDTWRMLAQQIVLMGLQAVAIGLVLQSPSLFTDFGFPGVHFGFAFILCSILLDPLLLLLGIPSNLLSRKAEFKADHFAAKQTQPSWLISALKVLARENLVNLNPHPLAVLFHYSHPPMNERIKALQAN